MAGPEPRAPADVRREIESERAKLANALASLRGSERPGVNVPLVAAAALGAGFVLAGGIGATVRLIFRRGREGNAVARVGRYTIIDHD
jgi:hypothetical protein